MVVRIEPPMGSGLFALFGLFSRSSPKEQKAKLEDVALTLKQKQKELREIERQIDELRAKAEAAEELDLKISQQQDALDGLHAKAEQKLVEFKRAESEFGAREAIVLQKEQEFQEQQALFDEKRRLLKEKEEALLQREDVIEERKTRAEQIEHAIKHAEVPLERRRRRIEAQIALEEKKLGELKSARLSALERRQSYLVQINSKEEQKLKELKSSVSDAQRELASQRKEMQLFEKQKSALDQIGKELAKAREALAAKAASVIQQEKDIRGREAALELQAAKLSEQISALEEAKRMILASQEIKKEAERTVEENRHAAEEAHHVMEENAKKLDELREKEKSITEAQSEVEIMKRDVESKLQLISSKEKNAIKKEMEWLDHQNRIKLLIDELTSAKRQIEETAAIHKGELANLRQQWDSTINALHDTKPFITSQKTELNRLVKGDINALRSKEQEVMEIITEFEKDRRKLEKQEKLVNARIKEIERARRDLEKANSTLKERTSKILQQESLAKRILAEAERARELKADIPRLKKEASQLRKEIAILRSTAEKHGARIIRIKQVEKPARHAKIGSISRAEHFKPAAPALRAPIAAAPSTVSRDELQEMIEGAKAAIQSNDVSSAMGILDDLESAARRLSEEDRRHLSYEIKDLRTSIKLAMLS
jgi:chromosome segregation ATPase